MSGCFQGQYRDPIAGVIRSCCNPRAQPGPPILYIWRHAQQIFSLSSHNRSSRLRYAGWSWFARSRVRRMAPSDRREDVGTRLDAWRSPARAAAPPGTQSTNWCREFEQASRSSGSVSRRHRLPCRGKVEPPSMLKPKRTTWGHGVHPGNLHGSPGYPTLLS